MRCSLRIAQTSRKSLVNARAGNSVHVTRDDDRTANCRIAKPLRTKQRIDLHQPLRASETKMGIDNLQFRSLYMDCGQRAPRGSMCNQPASPGSGPALIIREG